MLRVTSIQKNGGSTTLRLEGSLSGPWVEELRQCWAKLVAQEVVIEVDLRAVSFLDARGTDLLLKMEQSGARLFGSSAFIHNLLHAEALVRMTRPGTPSKKGKKEN